MKFVEHLVCLLLANAAIFPVTAHAADASVAASYSADASRLAELFVDANMNETVLDSALHQMTEQLFQSEPDLVRVNGLYPGLDKVFVTTMRPILADEMHRVRPLYAADIMQFYSSNFSNEEIGKLADFWASPPAQRVLKSAVENIDYSEMSKEMIDQLDTEGDITFSSEAVTKDVMDSAMKASKEASEADQQAFLGFLGSPLGRKFMKHSEGKRAIDMKWVNAPTPAEVEKRIDEAIEKAFLVHLEAVDTANTTGTI